MELTNQEKSLLSFQVGPFRICVQATEAESILELPEIHSIPLTPPSIAGMFLYRERVATAVDVARKLGLSDETEATRGQLIIAPLGEDIYGFLVDTVHELIPTEKIHWNSMRGIAKIEAFEHFGVLDDDIILFTSFRDVLDMKEIPLDDESLRTFIKSNRSPADQNNSQPDSHGQPLTTATSDSVEEQGPEVPADEDSGSSPKEPNMEEKISENERVSDEVAGPAEKADESATEVPEDAVTREEIEAFKNQQKKTDTGQTTSAPQPRKPTEQQRRSLPTQKQYPRRKKQSASRTYQQSQSRPARRTYVEESSFADRFTKKSLTIAAAIIIFLSAAIMVLRNGGEEKAEGVNVASVGTEVPRVKNDPAESAAQSTETDDPETEPADSNGELATTNPDAAASAYVDEPQNSREILRVDTDDFTLTVERGNTAEALPSNNVDNNSAADASSISSTVNPSPPGKRTSEYSSSIARNEKQKQSVAEPLSQHAENNLSAAASSKPTAPQPPDVEYVHVVKRGDTLWDISKQYLGNPMHYPELAKLSQISDPDWIYPGDVVRIRKK